MSPTAAPPATDPLIGRTVAKRFVVESVLGEGGMGKVYLVQDKETGQKAALKLVIGALSGNEEYVQRLRQEARTAGRLRHDGAVRILASGETETGEPYLAMEYCPGDNLKELLQREKHFDVARACNIVSQLVDAVGAAHRQGIIHRDLKPENIKVAPDPLRGEAVKVLDFGVAKFVGGEGVPEMENAVKTKTGIILGTPKYMAPEQIRGEAIDGRADLYSCGAILYEMLAGEPPFSAEDVFGYVSAHLKEPVLPLSERVPEYGIPKELDDLILWLLEKNPQQRPKDAAQVCIVLERYARTANTARVKFGMRVAGAWLVPAAASVALLHVLVPDRLPVKVPALGPDGGEILREVEYGMGLLRLHGSFAALGLGIGGAAGVLLQPRMSVAAYVRRLAVVAATVIVAQGIALAFHGAPYAAGASTLMALLIYACFSLAWPMDSLVQRFLWAGAVAPVVAVVLNPIPLRMYLGTEDADGTIPSEFFRWLGNTEELWQAGASTGSVGFIAALAVLGMGVAFGLGTLVLPKPGRGSAS